MTGDSPKAMRRMVHLLGQAQRGQHDIFSVTCATTSSAFLILTYLLGKRVSGVCAECKVRCLAAKNACRVTPHFAIWSSRQSCLCIILEPTTLITVKFRLYSHRSTFGSKNLQGYGQITQHYFLPGDYNNKIDGDGSGSDGKSDKD